MTNPFWSSSSSSDLSNKFCSGLRVDLYSAQHQTGAFPRQVDGQVLSSDTTGGARHLVDAAAAADNRLADHATRFEVLSTPAPGPWGVADHYPGPLESIPAAVATCRDGDTRHSVCPRLVDRLGSVIEHAPGTRRALYPDRADMPLIASCVR